MEAGVVHHDNLAWFQGWGQHLLDPQLDDGRIAMAFKRHRGNDLSLAPGCDHANALGFMA